MQRIEDEMPRLVGLPHVASPTRSRYTFTFSTAPPNGIDEAPRQPGGRATFLDAVIGSRTPRTALQVRVGAASRRRRLRLRWSKTRQPGCVAEGTQHGRNPRGEIGSAGHGHPGPGSRRQATRRAAAIALRMPRPFRASQHAIVACPFKVETQTAPGDPDQRMKPVDRARHARQHVDGPIVAANVLDLVKQGAVKIVLVPGWCVSRQNNHRAHQPHGQRGAHILAQQRGDRACNARVARKRLCERLRLAPARRLASQPSHAP